MKKIITILTLIISLNSCFKDEPLNAECDIELVTIHLDDPLSIFYAESDTLYYVPSDNSNIIFNIRGNVDVSALALDFQLTEGATVEPENGSVQDFSSQRVVTYTVTSQDGKWQRVYTIEFAQYSAFTHFSFENFYLYNSGSGEYYKWSDIYADGTLADNWATGNGGFQLSNGNCDPNDYPTTPYANGYEGYGVKLTTSSTGSLGASVGRWMAAGNLFLGYFDLTYALTNSLYSTNFGLPFDKKPKKLTAYYKYTKGDTWKDESGVENANVEDYGNIYAVMYRNHDDDGNAIYLHGDDIKTSPYIVAKADICDYNDGGEGLDNTEDDWTLLDVDFIYRDEIDDNLLENFGYSLAIVCTSSYEGYLFRGALNSTLYVDEIDIETEELFEE